MANKQPEANLCFLPSSVLLFFLIFLHLIKYLIINQSIFQAMFKVFEAYAGWQSAFCPILPFSRSSRLFLRTWASTLSSSGSRRWRWVTVDHSSHSEMCYSFHNKLSRSLLCMDRTAHGMETCHLTLTWIPTSTSSFPAFCKEAGTDASSFPASTQTSVQCKHNTFKVNAKLKVSPDAVSCSSQGASQTEQVPHPFPDSGNFWEVSWTDGHPLPNHSNCHKFRPKWEHSGEHQIIKCGIVDSKYLQQFSFSTSRISYTYIFYYVCFTL